ncbi:hypothetical protein DBR28_05775 [Chryseobacterium sp. HMWF028]|nr:hypothetical protein DBR28_05775 [Chryseobacterium sp. HMWF028]
MIRVTISTILFSALSYAQNTYSISGVVKDKDTGELVSGAIIKIKEKPDIHVESNEYGFYSLSLPENDYTLIIDHNNRIGESKEIHLHETIKIDWDLKKEEILIEEVQLKKNKTVVSTRSKMGAEILDVEGISKLPVLLGEKDILKTIQYLPGISSQEGRSGFSVRGGSPDQNLMLVDEAPVFNNSHLLGFFSTFNSDALRNATVYKGNIPSQYGGRLSSVVDVKMKEGNNQSYKVSGGLGLVSSRLSVEGPIQKGKSSFIISGRRTYVDLFIPPQNGSKIKLNFYDLNAKANFQINKNNSIHLSSYFGRDVLGSEDFKNNWGNIATTLRWNSIISSKLFSNTSLVYSNYDYKTTIQNYNGEFTEVNPNIRNIGIKQDFTHYAGTKHTLRYGLQSSQYYFSTPQLPESVTSSFLRTPRSLWENAIYINDDYRVSDKIFINYGLRVSQFLSDKRNSEEASTGNNFAKSYINFEPRIAAGYEFNGNNTITLGYNRNTQNIYTLNNTNGSLNNDLWMGAKKPLIADQINLGYNKKFNNGYEFNAEVFYKKMSNLVDYKDGVEVEIQDNIERNLVYNGKGRAYGLEILAKKTKGKFTGWFSYTLSKTERRNDEINNGDWYSATYDKTHNLSLVANYQLSPKWTFSGAFVYATGNAVTFPAGKYQIGDKGYWQYEKRNSSHMPASHRLDLNATYEPQNNKRFKSSWSFGIYNVYARHNPYAISFESQEGAIRAKKISFVSFVPNITYNFKF